ncbi:metal-dependent hydrolase [Aquihabitans sp. McL0605]|uniref:metal-dependent hydrolase n=1 Tax=Aquihabitans sp. McL0605 TaxID=3415671 RepID=UPI003CF5960C
MVRREGADRSALRVRARQVTHRWEGRPLPRHFFGHDIVLSHLAAMGSSVFPEGEAFFVRSVRRFRSQLTDPILAEQVTGFIGQETVHAREHRALNLRLAELGYPTRHLDRRAHWGLRAVDRVLSPSTRLAATAALEHCTATLADAILSSQDVRDLMVDDQIRDLVVWHALEEAEHKAVAFDVYMAVDGRHWLRAWTLRVAVVTTGLDIISGALTSMAFDPAARDLPAVWRSIKGLRTSPFAGLGMGAALFDYTRRDFHPDDHDTTALVAEWRARLFDEHPTDDLIARPR